MQRLLGVVLIGAMYLTGCTEPNAGVSTSSSGGGNGSSGTVGSSGSSGNANGSTSTSSTSSSSGGITPGQPIPIEQLCDALSTGYMRFISALVLSLNASFGGQQSCTAHIADE